MSKECVRNKTFQELNKYEFQKRYLTVLNCILPDNKYLSRNEINLLSVVLSLDEPMHVHNRFNTTARKIIRNKLKFTLSTITNTMKSLKDKGAIYINELGIITITNALVMPDTDNININITITKISDKVIPIEDANV